MTRSAFPTPAPATSRVRVGGLVVVVGVLAAAAMWLAAREDPTSRGSERPPGTSTDTATGGSSEVSISSAQLAPRSARDAPAGGVLLPAGTTQSEGHPTGFPYSDLGAVSVQVEFTRAQIGFDFDNASLVARLYADLGDQSAIEARSHDAVAVRRQRAGAPAEGEVPAPTAYAVTSVAFTVEELDIDYYIVNLLSYVTLTGVEGRSGDGLYAGTQLVRWVPDPAVDPATEQGGDWKVVEGSRADIDALLARDQPRAVAPGTLEFEQAGWIMIDAAWSAPGTGGTS